MERSKIITLLILSSVVVIAVLTSKSKSREQYDVKSKVRLFPFWVKYLGIAISLFSIITHWSNELDEQTVLRSLWQPGFAIGLLIIGLSKEKNEDEMTMSVRLNSVFMSFFSGIMAFVLIVLLNLLCGGNVNSFTGFYVVNYILILYHMIFYITKKKCMNE